MSDANPRAALSRTIPRRPRVSVALGIVLALVFGLVVTTAVTAERWLSTLGVGEVEHGKRAPITLRVAPFAGKETRDAHIGGGGVVIERGAIATREQADNAHLLQAATPRGALPYVAVFVLAFVFALIFSHHMRRSTKGRLTRVQIVNLVIVALLAIAVKAVMLATSLSILVIPIAVLSLVPTMVLDRVVGIATGVLAALVTSLLIPFDVSIAIVLLVQAATAWLVVAEHPKSAWRTALSVGAVTTLFTVGTVVLLTYLTTGALPTIEDPLSSPLVAAALGPAIGTLLAVPALPLYQLLVGEITQGKLVELEDLSNPLLRQIAERSPGTWQHSLMMANMAEIAANAIGASGRLVRVGAYYHDLGKSLQPKYFIENLEPGETSPHDQLPPEVSCDAIFAHVTEGIVHARRAGLHERIVDFMHMHHGNGVLEYFWGRCQEQGNPKAFTIDNFRYPGHPPQSRETAILAICDAVEAASRTLKKPDAKSIDALVQRIVYGKLHLGQLDESGLSMSDLRRISDSLRETIRHANHGRIEYPWQKAQQDASATKQSLVTGTHPRLDSLDRVPARDTQTRPATEDDRDAIPLDRVSQRSRPISAKVDSADVFATTAGLRGPDGDLAIVETAPALPQRRSDAVGGAPAPHDDTTRPRGRSTPPDGLQIAFRAPTNPPLGRARTESDRVTIRPRTESERAVRASRVDANLEAPQTTPPELGREGSGQVREPDDTRDAKRISASDLQERADRPSRPQLAVPIGTPVERTSHAAIERSSREDLRPAGADRSARPSGSYAVVRRSARPSDDYASVEVTAAPPQAQSGRATRPSTESGQYARPATESGRYARPVTESGRYARPVTESGRYARPATESGRYARPTTESGRYARPGTESGRYARPGTESGRYARPSTESGLGGDEARKRAATLPPTPRKRAPTVPPSIPGLPPIPPGVAPAVPLARLSTSPPRTRPAPDDSAAPPRGSVQAPLSPWDDGEIPTASSQRASGSMPAIEPVRDGAASRSSGPPPRDDLVTNPPPMRHTKPSVATRLPAYMIEEEDRGTAPRRSALPADALTNPDLGLPAGLERDEWSIETPVVAPSKAELRALLGVPDVTREQSIEEIDRLHMAAAEDAAADVEILDSPSAAIRRPLTVTAEVHPDDIESEIEIAPPARRTAIGVVKKKPPPK